MAIFAGMTELYWKHHRTSRLKFVWETIWEQLSLWLSQATFSEQHNPGVLSTGPDRLARKILAFTNMVENPQYVFCFESCQVDLRGHSHVHLPIITQRWLRGDFAGQGNFFTAWFKAIFNLATKAISTFFCDYCFLEGVSFAPGGQRSCFMLAHSKHKKISVTLVPHLQEFGGLCLSPVWSYQTHCTYSLHMVLDKQGPE